MRRRERETEVSKLSKTAIDKILSHYNKLLQFLLCYPIFANNTLSLFALSLTDAVSAVVVVVMMSEKVSSDCDV